MTGHDDEKAGVEKCRYMAAAYPTLDASDTCGDFGDHRHDEPTFTLARAMAEVFQQPDPSDEQVAWFLEDAGSVVDDFAVGTTTWTVGDLREAEEHDLDFYITINGVQYVIQTPGHKETSHPVALNEYRSWHCTCGMAEQERTGHSPQHEDWCAVSEEDDDDDY